MVGRKRKDGNPLGLEQRVYWKNGQWQHRGADGWTKHGTDVVRANNRAKMINGDESYGTIAYWGTLFLLEARAGKLPAGRKLAPRTISDYERELELIKESPLGKMDALEAAREVEVFGEYRDNRVDDKGRGQVQANHGLAFLSSVYAWLIERGHVRGLAGNPLHAVTRFTRKAKERYVEDHEFRAVYGLAQRSVCMAMDLVYSTLQRPQDVLAAQATQIREKQVAGGKVRVLGITQGKRGATVDIEITPELEATLGMLKNPADRVVRLPEAMVHGLGGKRYTVDGMAANLRKACLRAGVKTFGLMDVRAKGATDMYLRGVPLEVIQRLMRHKSKTTTEIYIKQQLATISTVRPNAVAAGK